MRGRLPNGIEDHSELRMRTEDLVGWEPKGIGEEVRLTGLGSCSLVAECGAAKEVRRDWGSGEWFP